MATRSSPRPLIGSSCDIYTPKVGVPYVRLNAGFFDSVLLAGGTPILIPPFKKENYPELDALLEMVSGVIMVGGMDLDPRKQGKQATNTVQPMAPRREDADRYLLGKIVERKVPLLAIGASMQLLNLQFGGSLFQHLPTDHPKAMPHFDPTGSTHRHMVNVEPNSTLEELYGAEELRVNSAHHQGINQLGKRLRVGAKAPDGVIEAIETTDETWFCLGVQWHPEAETASALDRQLFDNLIGAAIRFAEPAMVEAS